MRNACMRQLGGNGASKLSQLSRYERTAGRWISDHGKKITGHFLIDFFIIFTYISLLYIIKYYLFFIEIILYYGRSN